jgi:hypothetical protein
MSLANTQDELSPAMLKARTAVHSVILVGLIGFTAISIPLFIKNRHVLPIKARAPFLSSFAMLISVEFLALSNIIATIKNFQVTCYTWSILSISVGINGFFLSLAAKIVSLLLHYQAEIQKVEFATKTPTKSRMNSFGFILRVTSVSNTVFPMLGIFVFLIINIPLLIALGDFSQDLKTDPSYLGLPCNNFFAVLADGSFGFGVLFFIGLVAVSRKLSKVRDNHHLALEIKRILFLLIFILVGYLVVRFIPDVRVISAKTINFNAIFFSELPAFVVIYVCFFDMYVRSRKNLHFSFRKPSSKNTQVTNDYHQLNNNPELEKSLSKSVTSPTSKKLALNSRQEMEEVLENPEQLEAFRQFLQKEFCVEGLLFVEHIYFFKKRFDESSPADRTAMAFAIYSMFLGENSPLNVNISGGQRAGLKQLFTRATATQNISPDVFEKAYLEVINLLSIDTLQRFKSAYFDQEGGRSSKDSKSSTSSAPSFKKSSVSEQVTSFFRSISPRSTGA